MTTVQLLYFLGFIGTRLGLWSVFPRGHPYEKIHRIHCSSNLKSPGKESYTLPLSHAEPKDCFWKYRKRKSGNNHLTKFSVINTGTFTYKCIYPSSKSKCVQTESVCIQSCKCGK